MYLSPEDIEALYASIHRLAQQHVSDCTLAQVKAVAKRFHDRSTTESFSVEQRETYARDALRAVGYPEGAV